MGAFLEGSSQYRQERLKEIVQDLHEEIDVKAVGKRLSKLIQNIQC